MKLMRIVQRVLCMAWLLNAAAVLAMQPTAVELQSVGASEITLKIQFDSLRVVQKREGSTWIAVVEMPGYSRLQLPGKPVLPMTQLMLAIPPTGTPELVVVDQNIETRTVGDIERAKIESSEQILWPEQGSGFPERFIEMSEPAIVRHQRLVKLELYPVRYLAASQSIQFLRSATVRIHFSRTPDGSIDLPRVKSAAADPAFEQFYRNSLLNYEQAKAWRVQQEVMQAVVESVSPLQAPFRYKIYLQEDGVYGVSGSELEQAGADLSTIDPNTLAISNRGSALPILVEGGKDGRFDPQDRIVFIGQHLRGDFSRYSWYTDENVYWLTWGQGIGARFSEVSGIDNGTTSDTLLTCRQKIHLERDLIYERLLDVPREDLDHWFWRQMNGHESGLGVDLPVFNPVADSPLSIRVHLFGQTSIAAQNPDHHILFALNGQSIGEIYGDGKNDMLFEQHLQKFTLQPANNRLTFSLPVDINGLSVDAVLLDWVQIEYEKELIVVQDSLRFEIEGGSPRTVSLRGFVDSAPYLLTTSGLRIAQYHAVREGDAYRLDFTARNRTATDYYAVSRDRLKKITGLTADSPSAWRSTAQGADYIIITHADFIEPAQRLADYRRTQGYRTAVVRVDDVYDEFNHGIYDPRAIRAFVHYAYHHWQKPAPLFLLLFGDSTNLMDKKIARYSKKPSFVPAMMEYTRSWGMTASDNYFVAVNGDDILPDLLVGRFPAASLENAQNLVDKTIAYRDTPIVDDWRRQVCLLTGSEGGLAEMGMTLYRNYIPSYMMTNFLNTAADSPYFGTTEDLADYFNNGQVLLTFLGHGGGGVYLDTELFLTKDIALLNNQNKYPVIFSITCFVGHFDNADTPSLGEELLKAKNRGIVAHFGSAGRAYIGYYDNMHESLFDAIFSRNVRLIGEIATLGKLNAQRQGAGYWDHIKNYLLLGDPALALAIAENTIELTLSKEVLLAGDTLSVSGRTPGVASGQVVVSVYNEDEKELLRKSLPVQNGAFNAQLFELTDSFRQNWSKLWGNGIVRAYLSNGSNDQSGAASFTINEPIQVLVQPPQPRHLESIYFYIHLPSPLIAAFGTLRSVSMEWSANTTVWTPLPMQQEQPGMWRTTVPVVEQGGSKVNYRYKLVGDNGQSFQSDIGTVQIKTMADLSIDYGSVKVGGDNQPKLEFRIKNNGEMDTAAFTAIVYNGNKTEPGFAIDSVRVQGGVRAIHDTLVTISLAPTHVGYKQFTLQVDSHNEVEESNEKNNHTSSAKFIATMAKGSGGALYSLDGNFFCTIPANALSHNTAVVLDLLKPDSYQAAVENLAIVPLPLRRSKWAPCRLSFSDTTAVYSKPLQIGVFYDSADSLTACYRRQSALRLYGWNAKSQTWFGLDSQIDTLRQTVEAIIESPIQIVALFASTDGEPPQISLAVQGQNFADGDRVSHNPVITALIEDESGFDVSREPVRLNLNNRQIDPSQYTLYQAPDLKHQLTLTVFLELSSGEHAFAIEACDVNGNSAVLSTHFIVEGEFDLLSLANHPNPFAEQTTIAFYLTDTAEQVDLAIFTVSGRRIWSHTMREATGYIELDWDGLDEDGQPVANGVYYLRFTAVSGEKKIEHIEKMARLQ